jgi:DNA-binding LacI/PurR family transcriptional regulator
MKGTDRPSAILIAQSFTYLTAVTFFAQTGTRIPKDVSLLSRDEEVFLPHLTPDPARYELDAAAYAKALARVLDHRLMEEDNLEAIRLVPQLIPGKSLKRLI